MSSMDFHEFHGYCARILIEGARFPPFGFAIREISSSSNEYASFCQEDLSWHDSDRGHSVSPLRVRHSGDKPRSLEVPRRESRSEINLDPVRDEGTGNGASARLKAKAFCGGTYPH